jgi:signal transduction histidine kinase
MKWTDSKFYIGRLPTLTLVLLIVVILAGNGLVILQFERVRLRTDRLSGVSQQLIAVLRLQESLLSFDQRLNQIAQSKNVQRLIDEATPLHATLLQQARQTRSAFAYLPSEFRVDSAFQTVLNTIEITLPKQLQDVIGMASAGDWDAVRLRLDNELKRIETTASALVKSIERDLDEQLPHVVANITEAEQTILLLVPATAISTVLIAAFFGWAIARRILELRLEERVNERTRIARDLHDTLLQSFQALMLHLLPEGKAKHQLEQTLQRADQAIAEGRSAVYDLRSSATMANDLPQAVRALGDELATQDSAAFHLIVEGPARELQPLVRDELYRITREALRNAFSHARANHIETEIAYGERAFRLRIRDDGDGIPPEIVKEGRPGHYGLPGMRERARQIGGRLEIWSGAKAGTEIELSIEGSVAYRAFAGRPLFRLFVRKQDDV